MVEIIQQSARETVPEDANGCEEPTGSTANGSDGKSLSIASLGEEVRPRAKVDQQRRRRDSNPGWRICNPLPNAKNPEKNALSEEPTALATAASAEKPAFAFCKPATETTPAEVVVIGPDTRLNRINALWPTLSDDTRDELLRIAESSERQALPLGKDGDSPLRKIFLDGPSDDQHVAGP